MRILASPQAVEFVRAHGGRVFVWPVTMDGPTGAASVFGLEASTESPGSDRRFVRFEADALDVLFDPDEHGLPDELHLALRGRWRKRIRAYWNGRSFGRD